MPEKNPYDEMDSSSLPNSYGHTSGEGLPHEKVCEGRKQEYDNLLKFKVIVKRTRVGYKGKVVNSRWTKLEEYSGVLDREVQVGCPGARDVGQS